tara:strand:- start:1128 stop:1745 length:618 start_codon:yes stop_codon:yes gene_type:complete
MLSEKQLSTAKDELAKSITRRDLLSQEHQELRNHIADNDKKIKQNNQDNESLQKDNHITNVSLNKVTTEHNQLQRLIAEHEQALKDHQRDVDIKEMSEQQPGFYEVMTKRLKRVQEEISDAGNDFIAFVEAQEAVEAIEKLIEGSGYSHALEVLRSGKRSYDTHITSICTRRVDGETISIHDTKQNLDAIDTWLMRPEVINYWQK